MNTFLSEVKRNRRERLYQRILGEAWNRLAAPIRLAHTTSVHAHGHLRIEPGRDPLARMLAWLLRMPAPSAAAETRLIITTRDEGEDWQRTFNGRRWWTRQYKTSESDLGERFGVVELRFRLEVVDGSLLYIQRAAAFVFGPIRLQIPDSIAPRVEAREDAAGPTRVAINVGITLPRLGRLIAYDGIIEIEDPRQ